MYIFNAILQYAEKYDVALHSNISLKAVLRKVYDVSVHSYLMKQLHKLRILKINQYNNGDKIGADLISEIKIFPDSI